MSGTAGLVRSVAFLALLAWIGCSSSEEAGKDTSGQKTTETPSVEARPVSVPAGDAQKTMEPPPPMKEMPPPRQETPSTKDDQQTTEQKPQRPGIMMWSVQIGAFKQEAGAMQLFDDVKSKFNQPVYKDYDPVSGFYKITVGSFQTREQAGALKAEVQAKGYPDAFTVEVRR